MSHHNRELPVPGGSVDTRQKLIERACRDHEARVQAGLRETGEFPIPQSSTEPAPAGGQNFTADAAKARGESL